MAIRLSGSTIIVDVNSTPSSIVTALPTVGSTKDYGHYKITDISSAYKIDLQAQFTISLADRLNGNIGRLIRCTTSSAHVVAEGFRVVNGVTEYLDTEIVTSSYSNSGTNGTYDPSHALIHLEAAGSKLTWRGGKISAKQPLVFGADSEVIIENAAYDALGHEDVYANMFRIFTPKFKIRNLTIMYGQSLVDMVKPDKNWDADAGFSGIVNYGGAGFGLSGAQYSGGRDPHYYPQYNADHSIVDGGYWSEVAQFFNDAELAPKDFKLRGFGTNNSNNKGMVLVDKDLSISAKDFETSADINASGKVFVPLTFTSDMPDGTVSWSDGVNYTAKGDAFITLSNGTGSGTIIRAVNLRSVGGAQGSFTDPINKLKYTNSDGSNNYQIKVLIYGRIPFIGTIDIIQHSGDIVLKKDTAIGETDEAKVKAYTEIDTAQKFYDRAQTYLMDNLQAFPFNAERFVSIEGDTIDAGARNVTIDATATRAFRLNSSVSITIKADTFTGNITTTGVVTLANGATFVGGIIDANGDSYFTFEGIDSWQVYETIPNRASDTDALGSGTANDTFRFNYQANKTYYIKVRVANQATEIDETPANKGATPISLTTPFLITGLSAQVRQGGGLDEASLHRALDSYGGKGAWKADTAALAKETTTQAARDHARAANVQTQPGG